MNDKYFVISGNHYQYLDFVKKKVSEGWPNNTSLSMSNFIYVDDVSKLKGYSSPHGYFVGSWREREDIRDIVQQLWIAHRDSSQISLGLLDIVSEILQ